MPYVFDSRIRYSECDRDGFITPFAVINYMQDCSTFQSESVGRGVGYLKERHRGWFLNSWHIIFDRYPRFGEKIEAGTFAYAFKGLYGYRHFYIKDGSGTYAVRADSLWFFFDTEHHIPVKAEPSETEPYLDERAEELKLGMDMPKIERKVKLPAELKRLEGIEVTRHFIDSNDHVNNAVYVDFALSAANTYRPKELRAEYKKAAVLGDLIVPMKGGTDEKQIVSLADEDEKPYAVVELVN